MGEQNQKEETTFTFESSQFLRIPLNRIGAVIGVKGSIRAEIEKKTKTVIVIDSQTGEVEIRPSKQLNDPVFILKAKDVVRAIGRGFSSKQAMKLIEDESFLEIIRLKSLIGSHPNRLKRVRARVIGTQGKIRQTLEELTKANIVISGSTISLIGSLEEIDLAKEAIINIVKGSTVESVLGQLEDLKKESDKEEKRLWKSEDDDPTMKELFPEQNEVAEDIFDSFETED